MSTAPAWRAVAARAASLLLRYPDDTVMDALPLIDAAVRDLPPEVAALTEAQADACAQAECDALHLLSCRPMPAA